MLKDIIKASLIIIPLTLSFGLYPYLPHYLDDFRITKSFLATAFALAIVIIGLRAHPTFRRANPWIFILLGYCMIHPWLTPPLEFANPYDQMIRTMWIYQPMLQIFVYVTMLLVISQIKLKTEDLLSFCKIFVGLGLLTSIYVIVQALGWDQWQQLNDFRDSQNTTSGTLTAFFTHPNYAAAFLAITIPFTIYRRKWVQLGLAIIALCLLQSDVMMVGVLIGLFSYLLYRAPLGVKISMILGATLMIILLIDAVRSGDIVLNDNGRFQVWGLIWESLIHSPFHGGKSVILTGYGWGSYQHLIGGLFRQPMFQAHNEPLQVIFEAGLIGLGLIIFSLFWLLKKIFNSIIKSELVFVYALAFLIMLACSLGSFIFQIEPHRFIAVLLLGILHNQTVLKGAIDEK